MGGIDRCGDDADLRQQVQSARRGRSKNQAGRRVQNFT